MRRSITFSVTGNYEQVRRLVNFFELSDQFITLEQISLSGGASGNDQLSIRLLFSTLFVATDEDQKVATALAAIDRRNERAGGRGRSRGGRRREEVDGIEFQILDVLPNGGKPLIVNGQMTIRVRKYHSYSTTP